MDKGASGWTEIEMENESVDEIYEKNMKLKKKCRITCTKQSHCILFLNYYCIIQFVSMIMPLFVVMNSFFSPE